MTFVDQQWLLAAAGAGVAEGVGFLGIPYLCAEDTSLLVLYYAGSPGGDPLPTAMAPVYEEAVVVAMLEGLLGYLDLPAAVVVDALELPDGHHLPVIEGADEVDALSPGKELA